MRSKVAASVLSIALGAFCLGGAFTLAGCSGGGSTGGGVQQSTQTITFTQPASPVTYTPTLSITLSATGGGSGNPVVFSIDSSSTSKGTVTGNTVTGITAGKLVIDANQAGNTSYYAADQVQQTVVVNPATPTVSVWPTATAITAGAALSTSTLSGGSASVAGVFAWTAPTTVPAAGTDSESVTFTPTDATDYTSVTANVQVVVNPATPQITGITPRGIVSDSYVYNLSSTPTYTFTCSGCQNGDVVHDTSGTFPDFTLSLSSDQTTFGMNAQWQPGNYQPTFPNFTIQHPGGAYGNQFATAFFASASQSTLTCSPTTGRCFQVEQATGQIDWQDVNGSTGKFFSSAHLQSPSNIALDDATGYVVQVVTGTNNNVSPHVNVYTQDGISVCYINAPAGMSFISSVAARGGYMVFTDPVKDLVGAAKMDCTGYQTVSVAGQPWSVAMVTNGTEVNADVLARDEWSPTDGKSAVIKYIVPAMTVAGSVELDIPTITSIRSSTPREGIRQIVVISATQAAVLSASDPMDGTVLLVSTDTSNGKVMAVTNTVSVPELPFSLAASPSGSTLWVAYINATGGDNVTYAGTIDPTTGNYTPNVGTCPAGILAGGFTGTYCAQGSEIAPLQLTQ